MAGPTGHRLDTRAGASPGMTIVAHPRRCQAWGVVEQALIDRRSVRVRYHGHDRLICPHLLRWSNGRIVALVYQAGGSSGQGPLSADPRNRWRSLYLDEIEHAAITNEPWQTADNYDPASHPTQAIILAVDLK